MYYRFENYLTSLEITLKFMISLQNYMVSIIFQCALIESVKDDLPKLWIGKVYAKLNDKQTNNFSGHRAGLNQTDTNLHIHSCHPIKTKPCTSCLLFQNWLLKWLNE